MARPCRTCRTRKKACNGARPQCGTCHKSGRQCGGYEPHVKGIFVNLDASRMDSRIKSLIGDARETAKVTDSDVHQPTYVALHALDLSPGHFQSHFRTLMAHFDKTYAKTPSCWSKGVTSLGLHSRALDMALVSLATIRLSFTGQRQQYLAFSLSTYNIGLQIFRRLLQDSTSEANPQLVVISLVFTLFEASQQQPTKVYESGWAGHLTGALALMQRQGPTVFQTGGFHVAFRKLREMAILLTLSKKETTFLATPEWVKVPWERIPKTSRDALLDIALEMTTLYAFLSTHTDHIFSRCQRLYTSLIGWRQNWLATEHPHLTITCQGCPGQQCHCLPHPTQFPNNEFSYTAAEYTAILLFLTHLALQGRRHTSDSGLVTAGTHLHTLRTQMQDILNLPCFGRALVDSPGITEGRCRSLFAIWVLHRTASIIAPAVDDGWDWWTGLYGRVNYGVG